jgi:hypothetical protein
MKNQILVAFLAIISFGANGQSKIKDGTGTPAATLPAAGSLPELQSTQAGLCMRQVLLTNASVWTRYRVVVLLATSAGMTLLL